ncbi:hypothetical protein GA0111570_11279 [Raineyella antarctica]|uniref:Uncharacterized protein n=1 Tax=Raineyella antarctica TaxID=1577474 RepID=A0A1G6HSW2_9ACTN|nr:hypothetical protein [Raineyella antarctica]SDB97238.1 hypothetical protein GA0111570_11279 [Raineyella antarctica]
MTYDVARLALDERHTQLVKKSVGPVLLQFRAYATLPPGDRMVDHDEFYMMWMDLDRRGVPVPAVIRGALALATATAMTARVFGGGADPVPERIGWWQAAELLGSPREFLVRATARLAWLVDEDMGAFLRWDAPDPHELVDTEPAPDPVDPLGRWIFDRFTLSDPASWAPSSRALEDDPPSGVSRRLLALRVGGSGPEPTTVADEHVRARAMLAAGEREEAASVLTALSIVRPFDAALLLDLAEVVSDPERAAQLRRRAASLHVLPTP